MIQSLLIRRNPDKFYSTPARLNHAFIYYFSGGHRFDFADRSFCAKKGDLVLLPHGVGYSNTCLEEGTEYYQLDFRIPEEEEAILIRSEPVHLQGEQTEFFRLQIRKFEKLDFPVRSAANEALRRALIYEMLGELHRSREKNFLVQNGAERIESSLRWLHGHFAEEFSSAELAAHSGMELSYFEKVFRRCTGTTPVLYRNRLRMEEAKRLLGDNALSVAEVAFRVGFSDVSYFSKLFRRMEELPPGQYRRRILGP